MLRDDLVQCSGYLTKRGHVVTNWKCRFFVLRNNVLYYFADESCGKKLGQVHLTKVAPWKYSANSNNNSINLNALTGGGGSSSNNQFAAEDRENKFGFMFYTTKKIPYFVYATSEAERSKWLHALRDLYVPEPEAADCQGYLAKRGFLAVGFRTRYNLRPHS